MPILDVEVVGEMALETRHELAHRIAVAAGEALASRPSGTWVKVRHLDESEYGENADLSSDIKPVFVNIIAAHVPSGKALETQIALLTRAIAKACDRPIDNVHVIYQPSAKGRTAFGGRLIE